MPVVIPEGWTPVHVSETEEVTEIHAMPDDQDPGAWRDVLAYVKYPGIRRGSPGDYLAAMTASIRERCPRAVPGSVQDGKANGFDAAFVVLTCPRESLSGSGEISLVKAIAGRESLYVVQRAWRTEPFQAGEPPLDRDLLSDWVRFLSEIVVCDTRRPEHPCPDITAFPGITP